MLSLYIWNGGRTSIDELYFTALQFVTCDTVTPRLCSKQSRQAYVANTIFFYNFGLLPDSRLDLHLLSLYQSKMTHDSVWFSRPRRFGKGSRQWYVLHPILCNLSVDRLAPLAVYVLTRPASSASTDLTCVVSASARSLLPSDLSRSVVSRPSVGTKWLKLTALHFRIGEC